MLCPACRAQTHPDDLEQCQHCGTDTCPACRPEEDNPCPACDEDED